ncbi:condensin subunit Smc [Microcella putealis]|uniref:Chromosome partition protein Smc n=1 Tax=Microcella putealis TaxID=337005 RepID=A0A4Q7LZ18_9MICO|nr:AAA family ATPase [Microcella putealis]RZS59438.1 condensin subunit Smc [Microcella putealis]TQM20063.1 condensin subunit Smc [Microcella putealis]
MHLKSLTIKGFKSFAQPTTFHFEPGVTCIVGPNGSGKSNVVDALAWVMGEQGAKTLRGGKMEDVIFAGTATRGPLGRAEVRLTIDNSDGMLPIEYSEVTISRTLFRNGGSEYAINGAACRLLDVQELLSDSGLGREMHVIVGQGQLDKVLHASPEERRGFIEEAAGILKHRRRKEKTVRKLEAMQTNLTRLNDLAGEIRRQLTPLGRQAEIAREAQTIAAIVRDARARLLADEVVTLRRALHEHQRTEAERTSERIVVQEQLDQARLRVQRIESQMVGDAVDEARAVAFGLEQVQERLRSLSSLAQQKLTLLSQQAQAPGAQTTVTQGQIDEALAEAEELAAGVGEAERRVGEAAARTATARAALDSLDEEIAAQSALVSQHDLELQGLSGRVDVARSTLAAARGELLRQQNALEQAEARVAQTRADLAALPELEQAEGADAELDEALATADARVAELTARIDAEREQLHTLERERDALAARVSALSQAVDTGDGAAGLAGTDGVRGLVSDHLQVTPGYEAAIAAALGTLADAVLADDLDAGLEALRRVRDDQGGRVEVVLADLITPFDPTSGLQSTGGLVRASGVVTAPDGVLSLLAHTLIADDLEAARAAWPTVERLGAVTSVTVVTRDGEVLSRAVLRGGSGAGRSRLELAAERDTASSALDDVSTEIERARGVLDDSRHELLSAKEDATAALAAVRDQDAQRAARSEQLSRARTQAEAAEAEAERLAAGVGRAEESVREAEAAAAAAQQALDEFSSRPRPMLDASARDGLVAELDAVRAAEVEHRIALETARERVRAARDSAEQLRRRREAERAAAEEAARRAVLRQRQVDAARRVAAALPAVLAAADRSVAEARVALHAREAERSQQNDELSELRRTEAGLRERLSGITEGVHGLELQIYEKKLHLSQLLERAGDELGLVEDVLVAEYGPEVPVPDDDALTSTAQAVADAIAAEAAARIDPDDPFAENEPESADDGDDENAADADNAAAERRVAELVASQAASTIQEDGADSASGHDANDSHPELRTPTAGKPFVREEQQARLARAERKLGQLGRVNPLALEEFAALEQRHKFLTEQLTDLANTRRDLLSIIDELDKTMQHIFAEAFADTQRAFDQVFPILFPGGSGSLMLTDPESMLTTGIEVAVKPAGKKIERLSLLSGGERSLAAVALLIAIFKARPSPFYIMDEVEAALDDANLGRLLTIFRDLRESSQLIVITHQKRTMEIADALYGVSMRQDGVSAVVGQRVADPEAEPAAS